MSDPSPYGDADVELTELLVTAQARGKAQIEHPMTSQPAPPTGWQSAIHIFDNNVHALEIGTIDAPEWKIEDSVRRFASRAIVARAGLWGNHG